MNTLSLSQDYDADLMDTKDAAYFKNHLEDFYQELYSNLIQNDILLNFLYPYVSQYFDEKQKYINAEMHAFEARSLALKETIGLLDATIESSREAIDKMVSGKFDLDINSFIDSDTI